MLGSSEVYIKGSGYLCLIHYEKVLIGIIQKPSFKVARNLKLYNIHGTISLMGCV